jgi:GDPmannose 4,6-dehydratase
VSGILFNHESPLRPTRFVTQKIVEGALAIAAGEQDKLHLGNIDIRRDWGWAPEYVEAMHLMLQREAPEDFVIATGATHSLQEFVETAFSLVDLEWQDHVITVDSLRRPTDIAEGRGDARRAAERLGWHARSTMPDVVRKMIDARREVRAAGTESVVGG